MDGYAVDFHDLLGIRKLNKPGLDRRAFTDWAEQQISVGSSSSNLLILASLGLDKEISKDEVFHYFDAYIDEVGYQLPDDHEAFVLSLRLTFKKLAYPLSEHDLWSELSKTFVQWYDLPAGLLNRVVSYWSALHDDFVNNYEEGLGYYYLNYQLHGNVRPHQQADYIKTCALRFLRLYDEAYFYKLLLKS
ncbi:MULTISPECIES: MerR family transcriptional regulator [Lelliottia]|jgi:hypothetical protein|uniref:hypothetical protein n=1 Tax=Lelliottia aquatilis TaxID=2080838 RepID=UPI00192BE936|nr:hypothetical protein [Lelliottia aquatilis]MBL5882547.1 hypothetical protein [Lelliottia aquatilis]